MTTPPPGPCVWAIDVSCVPGWAEAPPADQVRAQTWASFILDALTGHQFDQCPIKVRPCGPSCSSYSGYQTWPVGSPASSTPGPWMTPFIQGGIWKNCACAGGCSCAPECRVDLRIPVGSIDEVMVNGLVLDPSAYELIGSWLVRTDGGECWPSCQDLSLPDTEDGTFSVTLRPGRKFPVAGMIAAGKLAGEFLKACSGAACALPAQIASLTRQGTDVEFVDPTTAFESGRTGIYEVDLFIQAVNPDGLRRRARVLSPDVHPARVGYVLP